MRRWIVILLALQLVLCATSLVRADGIFQRTPKVGEWTRFFYEMQADDEDEARTGTMTIRCLSFEKVEEVELATRLTDDDESVDLAFRMLIPANRFGKSHNPIAHIVRAVVRIGKKTEDVPVEELEEVRTGSDGTLYRIFFMPLDDAANPISYAFDTALQFRRLG